jgi:hypothetical protein
MEAELPYLKVCGRNQPRRNLTRSMTHQVVTVVFFNVLIVSTLFILVQDASSKVLVRVSPLPFIFLLVILVM